MAGKDKGSISRKRQGGAPGGTGGKKRKTEVKTSTQATRKAVYKTDKGKHPAKVVKQKTKAAPQTTVIKKGSKPKNKASKPKNKGTKTTQAKTAKQEKKPEVVLKVGMPKDDELERLGMNIGDKWVNLGRRLNIEEPKLQAIAKEFDSLHERGFQVLKHWKQKQGSGASYKSLSDALKHKLVERKDLAEMCCFKRQYSGI